MKKLIIVILSVLSIILIVELMLRFFYAEKLVQEKMPEVYRADSLWGFTYIPNTESIFIKPFRRIRLPINNMGYIGEIPIKPKTDFTYRILIGGRSDVTGKELPDHKDRFSTQLQIMIDSLYHHVEIINIAVDAMDIDFQRLMGLKQVAEKLNPDAIIFERLPLPIQYKLMTKESYKGYLIKYKTNSIESRNYCTSIVDDIDKKHFLTSVYKNSYIVRLVTRIFDVSKTDHRKAKNKTLFYLSSLRLNKVQDYTNPDIDLTIQNSFDTIKYVNNVLLNRRIQLYFFNYGKESNSTTSLFENTKVPIFNLSLDLAAPDFHLKDDGHLNAKGHAFITQALFEKIKDNNVIPKRYLKSTLVTN